MTTATAEKVTDQKDGVPAELYRGFVAPGKIVVEGNIRKHFNPERMKELAANVKKVGVLEPLLCRFNGNKQGYILIAGERRLRAAKEAGLAEVPVRVLDVTEQQAAEIQAFENLHRADLGPIEEARAFKMLLEKGKYTVEALAQRVDKSKVYVYRAVKLLDLPTEILEKIDAGELTPAHGAQVLRVPADARKKIVAEIAAHAKKHGRQPTAVEVRDFVESEIGSDLRRAPWPKDVPFAGKPPCSGCPFNSANQGDLFDDADGGKCTSRPCFDAKSEQVDKDAAVALQRKYPELKLLPSMREHELESKYKLVDVEGKDAAVKAVQNLIKAKPEAFSIAMVKSWEWRGDVQVEKLEPTVFVKESEKKLVLAALGKNHPNSYHYGGYETYGGGRSSGSSNANRRSPKDAFIDRFLDKELFKTLIAAAKIEKMTVELLKDAVAGYFSNGINERLEQAGYNGSASILKAAEKMSTEDRVRLLYTVLACKQSAYGPCDSQARAGGLDVKAVKDKHRDEALEAWYVLHPKQRPASKTGKNSSTNTPLPAAWERAKDAAKKTLDKATKKK
jgi:ParB/RepB/Spo0J family partition protein